MKKIRLNTRFLATEGIPQLLTVAMIPFTMIVYFSGWLRGGIETTICASVFFSAPGALVMLSGSWYVARLANCTLGYSALVSCS